MKISDVYRKEYNIPVETIHIGNRTVVDHLVIDHVINENYTGEEMHVFVNKGSVDRLVTHDICADGVLVSLAEAAVGKSF